MVSGYIAPAALTLDAFGVLGQACVLYAPFEGT